MLSILHKELVAFFSSLIAYIAVAVFLLFMGLMLFVFPDYSILSGEYATLGQFFDLAPYIFLFFIPALTMRMFSEEYQTGTLEWLATKPLTDWNVILGKWLSCVILILFALLPTLLYFYTVYRLGSPVGNVDSGAIAGSYVGLLLLGATFSAIGIFASSLTRNQIVSFILSAFLCFVFYLSFDFISRFPVFIGHIDDLIMKFGIEHYYRSISRGILDTRDILYFFSLSGIFLYATYLSLQSRKW